MEIILILCVQIGLGFICLRDLFLPHSDDIADIVFGPINNKNDLEAIFSWT